MWQAVWEAASDPAAPRACVTVLSMPHAPAPAPPAPASSAPVAASVTEPSKAAAGWPQQSVADSCPLPMQLQAAGVDRLPSQTTAARAGRFPLPAKASLAPRPPQPAAAGWQQRGQKDARRLGRC